MSKNMTFARVIRPIWATKKDEKLKGIKLLEVEILDYEMQPTGELKIVADNISAGIGDIVLTCVGSKVRNVIYGEKYPFKEMIIAIVDNLELRV
jgi:microcompartment protein CcmK/EutM